jgi:hypothetical protein
MTSTVVPMSCCSAAGQKKSENTTAPGAAVVQAERLGDDIFAATFCAKGNRP